MHKIISLEKVLQKQGFGSRKLCRIIINNGEVTVNDVVCDNPDEMIDTNQLRFSVRGENWEYHETSYLMMNKPANYECSRKTIHHPTIYSLLPYPIVQRGVQCIGRLDEDTTGLILLSDDGQFIHKMSSPKHNVPKVYEVVCKHDIDHSQISKLLNGVQLMDEPLPIAALACESISPNTIHLTLSEGKYHQVKRMIAAVSNRVVSLNRIKIGDLDLPIDLPQGKWRWLSDSDLSKLI